MEIQHPNSENSRLDFIESVLERKWQMRHLSRHLVEHYSIPKYKGWTPQPQMTRKCKNHNTISIKSGIVHDTPSVQLILIQGHYISSQMQVHLLFLLFQDNRKSIP